MSDLRFDGRVAVVTGGGRGIGLAYCRLLAARGARVVLNDLGVAMEGGGSDAGLAAEAAESIRRDGGAAEADVSDVSTGDGARELVAHALHSFGSVDIVVSNAGIFWTERFPDVSREALDRQLAVHVGGAFEVSRAAWPHMAAAGYGRVVMTTSSGALGSPNLTSYGTAKAAVLGLTRSLAMSGREAGIRVNAVAPMAMTRMMAAGMKGTPADEPADERDPGLVAPLVALLCHDRCPVTGEAFNAGMRRFSRFVIAESEGYLHSGADVSPEDVLSHWDEVMDPSRLRIVTDTFDWAEAHFGLLRSRGTIIAP
jgi:NAD(P)-dependent dehydrogenase (short-subunit alcohol dehydrogenase family)